MQNTFIAENASDLALVQMFQVEELEERLENKWSDVEPDTISVGTSTNTQTGATTISATATWKIEHKH